MNNNGHSYDVKGLIAVMVIAGAFAILVIYVLKGQVPDATVVGMVSLPLGAVIGFYFGHINGAATALADATTKLALAAQSTVEKRAPLPVAVDPVTAAAAAKTAVPLTGGDPTSGT